jgi:hypothetical protein
VNCQRDIRLGASIAIACVFGGRGTRYRADWLTFTPVEADIVRSGDGLFGRGKIQWLSRAKSRIGGRW